MQITKCASTAETGKAGESSRDLCSSWPGQRWKCYHENRTVNSLQQLGIFSKKETAGGQSQSSILLTSASIFLS